MKIHKDKSVKKLKTDIDTSDKITKKEKNKEINTIKTNSMPKLNEIYQKNITKFQFLDNVEKYLNNKYKRRKT
jgi:hypothetical protein